MTQSQAISQSFRVFITFRSMRDTTCFHFSKLIFCTKYRFFYHGDQEMSWWCRWRAVNFEIHLWSSGMNADCIWRSISIQHVQIEAGLNSDPGNDSFSVEIRDAKHVDRSTHTSRCRSTQVKLYWFDRINWPLTSRDVYFFGNIIIYVLNRQSTVLSGLHHTPQSADHMPKLQLAGKRQGKVTRQIGFPCEVQDLCALRVAFNPDNTRSHYSRPTEPSSHKCVNLEHKLINFQYSTYK